MYVQVKSFGFCHIEILCARILFGDLGTPLGSRMYTSFFYSLFKYLNYKGLYCLYIIFSFWEIFKYFILFKLIFHFLLNRLLFVELLFSHRFLILESLLFLFKVESCYLFAKIFGLLYFIIFYFLLILSHTKLTSINLVQI
jgi:hypothetical protein